MRVREENKRGGNFKRAENKEKGEKYVDVLLQAKLSPQYPYAEILTASTSNEIAFGDRACKEVVKVKSSHTSGFKSNITGVLIRRD